jgi:hypothetical protein
MLIRMFFVLFVVLSVGISLVACGSNKDSDNEDKPDTATDWWDVDTKNDGDESIDKEEAKDSKDGKSDGKESDKKDGAAPIPSNRFTAELNLAGKTGSARYYDSENSCDMSFELTISETDTSLCEGCASVHKITYGEAKITTDGGSCTEGTSLATTDAIIGLENGGKTSKLRQYANDAWITEELGYSVSKAGKTYIAWGPASKGAAKK